MYLKTKFRMKFCNNKQLQTKDVPFYELTVAVLWPVDRSVRKPGLSPGGVRRNCWEFRGGFLIEVDPHAGLVVGIQITVPVLRHTGEDLHQLFVITNPFLDSKIGTGEVEVKIGRMPDR